MSAHEVHLYIIQTKKSIRASKNTQASLIDAFLSWQFLEVGKIPCNCSSASIFLFERPFFLILNTVGMYHKYNSIN